MAMTINTNVVSINAQRNLSLSGGSLSTTMQRLSSGLRVNSAKDDAAGLAIAERMNAQSRGLAVAARNANDGISLAQTAEGALGKVGDMLQRMRELAVQSSNATNSKEDREALQAEVNQLRSEIDRVAKTTSFNGQKILDGSFTGGVFQVGAGAGDNITVGGITNAKANALGAAEYGKSTSGPITADAVVGFGTAIDKDQLFIRVGANKAVGLGEIAAASSGTERMGQVVAAINAKTADTGVTAFLEEKDGAYTLQLRSNSGDAVSLQGFNAAQTGFGAAVTVGLGAAADTPHKEYLAAKSKITTDWPAATTANLSAAFVKADGTLEEVAGLKAVTDNFSDPKAAQEWSAGLAAFNAVVAKAEQTGAADARVLTDAGAATVKAALADLGKVLDTAAALQGATNNKAVFDVLDDVMKLDATALSANDALDTLNEKLKAAGAGDGFVPPAGTVTADTLNAARNAILSKVDEFMSGSAGVQQSEAKVNTGIDALDISSQAGAWEAIETLDAAIDQVNAARADLGALQTRFEKAIENIDIQNENISAARGRIVDADFATETANLSRAQILQQAGTAMVAQANQLPQGVLSLLQ
ncbi:flagellin [Comamonas kerstersii]|uniref:flagellin N-terminal helical domain-containing protein n=1 Tax=Comamonas kerstersii TaxID=225992 RepID=UPI002598D7DC|nr:flagellin [Comamonas kerstersii]